MVWAERVQLEAGERSSALIVCGRLTIVENRSPTVRMIFLLEPAILTGETCPSRSHAHARPATPDDRRAEIARRNGALSRGPATPEGKARSAMNATRHGLCGRAMPEGADAHELADLRAALLARWQPADAAEAHLVEELVFAAWRQMRLRAVEDAVLARAERGEEPGPGLPSLATLIRYRGRIDRDAGRATDALVELRRRRKEIVDPMRLRWLAERIEQAQAIAAAIPAAADNHGRKRHERTHAHRGGRIRNRKLHERIRHRHERTDPRELHERIAARHERTQIPRAAAAGGLVGRAGRAPTAPQPPPAPPPRRPAAARGLMATVGAASPSFGCAAPPIIHAATEA